jgi:hypothetical protein
MGRRLLEVDPPTPEAAQLWQALADLAEAIGDAGDWCLMNLPGFSRARAGPGRRGTAGGLAPVEQFERSGQEVRIVRRDPYRYTNIRSTKEGRESLAANQMSVPVR